jgi:hypothetical protein
MMIPTRREFLLTALTLPIAGAALTAWQLREVLPSP